MRSKLGLIGVGLVFVASACGEATIPRQALPTSPSPSVPVSPTASLTPSPSPSPTPWQTYSDPDFGFTISYPPDFQVDVHTPDQSTHQGWLSAVRFFAQSDSPPQGKVVVSIYAKDADSLESWVEKHSAGDTGPDDPSIYYREVSGQQALHVSDRPALAFDWQAGPTTVHVVCFFSGERVMDVHWYADVASYAGTIEQIFDQMLDSYED